MASQCLHHDSSLLIVGVLQRRGSIYHLDVSQFMQVVEVVKHWVLRCIDQRSTQSLKIPVLQLCLGHQVMVNESHVLQEILLDYIFHYRTMLDIPIWLSLSKWEVVIMVMDSRLFIGSITVFFYLTLPLPPFQQRCETSVQWHNPRKMIFKSKTINSIVMNGC